MKKKGYFFVVDAFVASVILIITLMMVLELSVETASGLQASTLSYDYINLLSNTLIAESSNELIIDWKLKGIIVNDQNTLLEQIGAFYHTGEINSVTGNLRMKDLATNLTNNLLPRQYSINMSIDGTTVYSRIIRPMNDAEVLTPARRIVIGQANRTHMFGPYTALVLVWE